jgi:hypothetical protein
LVADITHGQVERGGRVEPQPLDAHGRQLAGGHRTGDDEGEVEHPQHRGRKRVRCPSPHDVLGVAKSVLAYARHNGCARLADHFAIMVQRVCRQPFSKPTDA